MVDGVKTIVPVSAGKSETTRPGGTKSSSIPENHAASRIFVAGDGRGPSRSLADLMTQRDPNPTYKKFSEALISRVQAYAQEKFGPTAEVVGFSDWRPDEPDTVTLVVDSDFMNYPYAVNINRGTGKIDSHEIWD